MLRIVAIPWIVIVEVDDSVKLVGKVVSFNNSINHGPLSFGMTSLRKAVLFPLLGMRTSRPIEAPHFLAFVKPIPPVVITPGFPVLVPSQPAEVVAGGGLDVKVGRSNADNRERAVDFSIGLYLPEVHAVGAQGGISATDGVAHTEI